MSCWPWSDHFGSICFCVRVALSTPSADDSTLEFKVWVWDFYFESPQSTVGVNDRRYERDARVRLGLRAAHVHGYFVSDAGVP